MGISWEHGIAQDFIRIHKNSMGWCQGKSTGNDGFSPSRNVSWEKEPTPYDPSGSVRTLGILPSYVVFQKENACSPRDLWVSYFQIDPFLAQKVQTVIYCTFMKGSCTW